MAGDPAVDARFDRLHKEMKELMTWDMVENLTQNRAQYLLEDCLLGVAHATKRVRISKQQSRPNRTVNQAIMKDEDD